MERRKYIRLNGEKIRVKIRKFRGERDGGCCNAVNFSYGGILLSCQDKLEQDDYVILVIDAFKRGLDRNIKCVSQVRRVEKVDNMYDIAFEFVKITQEEINYLKSLSGEDDNAR
jgi:hypothetical protein